MKGKGNKEKRYFCDWCKKYVLCVEDEVYVNGEWIFTPSSEKIVELNRRIGTRVIVMVILISIAICFKYFYPQGIYYTLFIEKSQPIGTVFIAIFIGWLIGVLACLILAVIFFLSMYLAYGISEKRKYKNKNKN